MDQDTVQISVTVRKELDTAIEKIARDRTRQLQEAGKLDQVLSSDIVREALETYLQHYGIDIGETEDDEELTPEEEIEQLKALYPEYVIDGELDIALVQKHLDDGFRQAWHEAMTGQTRPIEDILAELDES